MSEYPNQKWGPSVAGSEVDNQHLLAGGYPLS